MSTGQMITLIGVLAGLSLGTAYVLSHQQSRIAVEMVQAHQASLQGVLGKLQDLEERLQAESAAQAELTHSCQTGLQETGLELRRRMEGLLVKQELRLIRTLGMTGAAKPTGEKPQQVIQPISHQRVSPQDPQSGQSEMQVVGGVPEATTGEQR